MNYTFKLARRMARLRAVVLLSGVLATGACDNADQLGPMSQGTVAAESSSATGGDMQLEVANSSGKGVTFGAFDLPDDKFSGSITGAVRAVGPGDILPTLEAARRAGARVVVRLSASEKNWTNSDHSVNLAQWESQVVRFKPVNIQPYIDDGTLLAHYLIDEPHDPSNWGGQPVPYQTLEAMAQFSKQLWPGLTTVARSYPDWLSKAPFKWKYLDAAWSQYSARKGEVKAWIKSQASYAKQEGLALIVGLNWLDGGTSASGIKGTQSGSYAMSASQIKEFGSALVSNPYACAVYNWKYSASYVGRTDIESAIEYLAAQAKTRPAASCGRSAEQPPTQEEGPTIIPSINPGAKSSIQLKASGRMKGKTQYMSLDWTGAKGSLVDVYRSGARTVRTENDGHYVNTRKWQGGITYVYRVCQKGTSVCSRSASVRFR